MVFVLGSMHIDRCAVAASLVALLVALPCPAERCAAVVLPGEPATRAALEPYPFPDQLTAYVWRNWFLVPHARLASVVGASVEELSSMAKEMGLPEAMNIPPEWRRKGYITVLRRNWHLLNYPQLLELLDMSREELRFLLMEDDFLFHKLGDIKPKCNPLKWDSKSVAASRSARQKIAQIINEEHVDDFTEEPRFSFVKTLSTTTANLSTQSEGVRTDASPFDIRLIFSYFADYGDPLIDPDIGSYPEGLLQKLALQGVNAVWLHTVLRTLAKDPVYPEFGKDSEKRMVNLRKLIARAAKYGIKVYLYMNEPRAMPDDFFRNNPKRELFRGAEVKEWGLYAMCTSVPEVRRWVRDSLEQVFRAAPGLGGIFTITMNENLTNCASKGGKRMCPRCSKRNSSEIVAEINASMVEGMAAGNPDAIALIWDWSWNDTDGGVSGVLARLPKKNIRIMSVSEQGMGFERGGVKGVEEDYSISIVGPGEKAKSTWGLARGYGLKTLAKVQANCSWELSPFPYLPVVELVSEHAVGLMRENVDGVMLSWSLGCCPAPNLSVFRDVRKTDVDKEAVLDRLAIELYGKTALPTVRAAWHEFATGFREYPFSIGVVYCGPQHWGPANPLYLKATGWDATMVGIPYDDLTRWCYGYPSDVWISQMDKVESGFRRGCDLFAEVVANLPSEKRSLADRELSMFKAEMLHFRSSADQARFVMARNRADRAEMSRLTQRELETAKLLLPIVRSDSRIGYESSNHYFYVPQDVREKVLSCRAVLDDLAALALRK